MKTRLLYKNKTALKKCDFHFISAENLILLKLPKTC